MSEFAMPIMEGRSRGPHQKKPVFTWTPTPHQRAQAISNHSQSLERLRERGGVGWGELYCIFRCQGLFTIVHNEENEAKAKAYILANSGGVLS